ncbi:Cytidine deaminase [Taenia crassiceps]|uniref:Cytidine deaminase n=1 Tax=Taenia crassiceps TaxID=6207 RepID=A0ABR4QQY8_9CEST
MPLSQIMASTLTPEMDKVRKASLSVLKNAYCAYSGFPVAVALLDPEGRIFKALTAGVKDFVAMAVAVDRDEFATPCEGGDEIEVVLFSRPAKNGHQTGTDSPRTVSVCFCWATRLSLHIRLQKAISKHISIDSIREPQG